MIKLFTVLLSAVLFFLSCNKNETSDASATKLNSKSAPTNQTNEVLVDEPNTVIAQFEDFALGDASHYSFKDKSGKVWDFGRNEVSEFQFSQELPEKEANEENQGWQANKKLVGKWFKIKYEVRKLPLYQDGPMGDVLVIVRAMEVK